jgi:tripeptide aminopeptidase
MRLGQVDSETTANIGSISGGGETNIVGRTMPDRTAECRSRSQSRLHEQADHMEQCVRRAADKAGARAEVRQTISYLPYQIERGASVAARFARAWCSDRPHTSLHINRGRQ